jgi:hypothetical protein
MSSFGDVVGYVVVGALLLMTYIMIISSCVTSVREDSVTVESDHCQMIRIAMLIRNEQLDCEPISLSCPELMYDWGILSTNEVATMCANRIFAIQECEHLLDALDACSHLGSQH